MSETEEHKAIVAWFRSQYPEYALCLRVSQSGRRSGSSKRAAMAWAAQVAMGAVQGESDIAINLPRGGFGSLMLEHKAEGAKHTASPAQIRYIEHHNAVGNCAVVTRGIEMAKAAITQYMGQAHGQ